MYSNFLRYDKAYVRPAFNRRTQLLYYENRKWKTRLSELAGDYASFPFFHSESPYLHTQTCNYQSPNLPRAPRHDNMSQGAFYNPPSKKAFASYCPDFLQAGTTPVDGVGPLCRADRRWPWK